MSNLLQDVRYGCRMLIRNPLFTLVAALSLGLGIGANTAIFSLIDQVMFRMLPVKDPGELAFISRIYPYPRYEQFRDLNQVFTGVAAVCALDQVALGAGEVSTSDAVQSDRVSGRLVSGSYFSLLGAGAAVGRTLTPEDDRTAEAHPVAVISNGLWKRRFASDPGIVGRTIHLGPGRPVWGVSARNAEPETGSQRTGLSPFTVVGVMSPSFFGETVGDAPDFWAPVTTQSRLMPGRNWLNRRDVGWVRMVARRRPGITEAQAEAGMNMLFRQLLADEVGSSMNDEIRRFIRDAQVPMVPGSRGFIREEHGKNSYTSLSEFFEPLWILMAVVGVVLVIACANTANLLLARAFARQREIAVRLSLGATRMRLVRQLLTESVLLSLLGGMVGLLFARWASSALLAMASGFLSSPLAVGFQLDPRLLLFAAALSLVTGLVFGVAPAFRATDVGLSPVLKGNAGTVGSSARAARLRKALVVAQVAMSLTLLIGAALFVRSLQNQQAVDIGYDRENLALARIDPLTCGYSGPEIAKLADRLRDRFQSVPGVRSVTFSENGLFSGPESAGPITVDGYTPQSERDMFVRFDHVGPGYFGTVGIPLLLGRDISAQDIADRPRVAVINEALARKYFGDANPLGKRISWIPGNRASLEIIGVSRNVQDHSVRWTPPSRFYVPLHQPLESISTVIFEIRTSVDPENLLVTLRAEIRAEDQRLPVLSIGTLREMMDRSMAQDLIIAVLSGFFGVVALLLATIGLYGIMSYSVTQRTRDIGIRIALGAEPRHVVRGVLREAILLVLAGLALGIPAAIALTKLVSSWLFGLKPTDPTTIAASALFLLAVAAVAGYLPARRAARVDPIVALREESY